MVFRILIAFLFSLVSICYQAQNATVIFNGTENFQVTINEIPQHTTFGKQIKIVHLQGNQPYNVKIHFKNDSVFAQNNIYTIDNGFAHIYTVNKKTIDLKKIIPTVSYQTNEELLSYNYIENTNLQIDTIITDTLITDTSYTVPFASYYKLEDYEGRIGCPFPIKDVEQAKLRGVILAENLEESKLEKVQLAIEDLDSACVLVDQVKELMQLLEFEETRLAFGKFVFPYTFDIDNYEKLYPLFNFENSKDQLRSLLKD